MESRCFSERDRFKPYQIKRFIANPRGSVITDVLLWNDEVAGWACYFTRENSRVIRLYTMCVLPEKTGKGIAQTYLARRMKDFRKYRTMALEVRKTNRRAIGLYRKLGFEVANQIDSYYPDGEAALRMVIDLK